MDGVVEPERDLLRPAGRAEQVEGGQGVGQVPEVVVVPVRFAPARQEFGAEPGPAGQQRLPPLAQRPSGHHSPISHQARPAQAAAKSTLVKVPMMNRSAAPELVAFSSG